MNAHPRQTILVIDDDEHLVRTLADFLAYKGFKVVTARSGEEGLKRLETVSPDMIVLDISMPGMGGIGFLRRITGPNGRPKHPVLVLTARAAMKEFFDTLEVDDFLPKPCLESELLRIVNQILLRQETLRSHSEAKGHPTVLLGDDRSERTHLAKRLRAAGYTVEMTDNGPELIELTTTVQPDVVCVRQMLPKMKGALAASLIHAMPTTRHIPILLFDESVVGSAGTSRPARLPAGVTRFLASGKADRLLEAIQAIAGVTTE